MYCFTRLHASTRSCESFCRVTTTRERATRLSEAVEGGERKKGREGQQKLAKLVERVVNVKLLVVKSCRGNDEVMWTDDKPSKRAPLLRATSDRDGGPAFGVSFCTWGHSPSLLYWRSGLSLNRAEPFSLLQRYSLRSSLGDPFSCLYPR